MICPSCQTDVAPRRIYCSEKCRKREEKRRAKARTAPARAARFAAYLAENRPKWEAIRAAKAQARAARPPKPPPKSKPKRRLTLLERLEALSVPEPNSGCRLWLGKVSRKGYAMIWFRGTHRIAPRIAFEAHKGPIPEGMMVCHHCDNPACIELKHLYAGTAQTNYDDMVRRGRRKAPYSIKDRPPPKPKPSAYGRKRYAGMGI